MQCIVAALCIQLRSQHCRALVRDPQCTYIRMRRLCAINHDAHIHIHVHVHVAALKKRLVLFDF